MIVVWNVVKQWISWFGTIVNAANCNIFFVATGWVVQSASSRIESLIPENGNIKFVWVGYTFNTVAFVSRTIVETTGNWKMFDRILIGTEINGASTINSGSSDLDICTAVGVSTFNGVPDLSWPWTLNLSLFLYSNLVAPIKKLKKNSRRQRLKWLLKISFLLKLSFSMNGMKQILVDDQHQWSDASGWNVKKNSSEKNVDELNQYATVCIRDDKEILVNWHKFSPVLNPFDAF